MARFIISVPTSLESGYDPVKHVGIIKVIALTTMVNHTLLNSIPMTSVSFYHTLKINILVGGIAALNLVFEFFVAFQGKQDLLIIGFAIIFPLL